MAGEERAVRPAEAQGGRERHPQRRGGLRVESPAQGGEGEAREGALQRRDPRLKERLICGYDDIKRDQKYH